MIEPLDQAVDRVVRFPLQAAGFVGKNGSWVWFDGGSFVAFSARTVWPGPQTTGGAVIRFGWSYAALGDPPPDPPMAEGCVRQLSIDELTSAAAGRLATLPELDDEQEVAGWEWRLASVWRRDVQGWLETWKRPEGFRDYLTDRGLHLAAAWMSALLGHRERVELELRSSASLVALPVGGGFDRHRADQDEALAAPFAARHGLAALLAEAERAGDHASVAAFAAPRLERARRRVVDPADEHRRLLRRHEVYAALCVERLRSGPAGE